MPGTYRSGTPAKPSAFKRLEGTKVRPDQRNEPQHALGEPEIPAEVLEDPLALACWHEHAGFLRQVHVLSLAHGRALAALSLAVADFQRVRAAMRAEGHVIMREGPHGMTFNPLIRESQRLTERIVKLLGEFGLTPVTSPKITAHAPPDTFQTFLGAKPGR